MHLMVADHASEHIVHCLYLSKALGLDGFFFFFFKSCVEFAYQSLQKVTKVKTCLKDSSEICIFFS